MPRLTIIMPVYNASRFIEEALKSILQQAFKDFELWIVDDGSTDNSISIVKSFQDSRIKIFKNEANLGRVRTANRWVKEISSEFFTVTDADDISHPLRLQKQIEFLDSHPDYVMCGTSYWAVDEGGFLVREMRLKTNVSELRHAALQQSQFLGGSTVMRKSVLEHFPHFYREYFIDNFADADLAGMILDKFNATNIDEPLYFYRIVRSSLSRKKITVRNLNLHRLVGWLSKQRRELGQDCLQRGAVQQADDFMNSIQKEYDRDPSFFFRHQAFFHLYWGINDLAFQNGWKAFQARPWSKNILSLLLIIFQTMIFKVKRIVKRKHFTKLCEIDVNRND